MIRSIKQIEGVPQMQAARIFGVGFYFLYKVRELSLCFQADRCSCIFILNNNELDQKA